MLSEVLRGNFTSNRSDKWIKVFGTHEQLALTMIILRVKLFAY